MRVSLSPTVFLWLDISQHASALLSDFFNRGHILRAISRRSSFPHLFCKNKQTNEPNRYDEWASSVSQEWSSALATAQKEHATTSSALKEAQTELARMEELEKEASGLREQVFVSRLLFLFSGARREKQSWFLFSELTCLFYHAILSFLFALHLLQCLRLSTPPCQY